MKKQEFIKFDYLLDLCGGSLAMARELNVHQVTVERWRRCGIPKKYFYLFERYFKVDAFFLRALNEKISNEKTK